jgi:hypothetical protein
MLLALVGESLADMQPLLQWARALSPHLQTMQEGRLSMDSVCFGYQGRMAVYIGGHDSIVDDGTLDALDETLSNGRRGIAVRETDRVSDGPVCRSRGHASRILDVQVAWDGSRKSLGYYPYAIIYAALVLPERVEALLSAPEDLPIWVQELGHIEPAPYLHR